MSGENFQELRKGQNVEELSRLSFGMAALCLFWAGKLRNMASSPAKFWFLSETFRHIFNIFAKLRSCFKLTVYAISLF